MDTRLLTLGLMWAMSAGAIAQSQSDTDAEIKRLKDELVILTAKNDIAAAKYGEALKGKSGDVTNADKLSGMAYQHLPWATQQVGAALGDALDAKCGDGTVVMSGAALNVKLASAISFTQELARLNQEIIDATPKKGGFIASTALSAVGAAVALAGLFKSDYAVYSADMAVDMDWLVASMVLNRPNVWSERFPDRTSVDYYIANVDALRNRANSLAKSTKKDEIVKRVDALIAALYKPDNDGVLPIVTTALLSPITTDKTRCLAVITGAKAAPVLMTKETIWGKGGRAFVYLPVQASVIQVDSDGKPHKMACRIATVSAPIKLSDLTKKSGATSVPWSGEHARYAEAVHCSSGGSPVAFPVEQKKSTAPASTAKPRPE